MHHTQVRQRPKQIKKCFRFYGIEHCCFDSDHNDHAALHSQARAIGTLRSHREYGYRAYFFGISSYLLDSKCIHTMLA